MLLVHKYGGSSVATFEKIKQIANHLKILSKENDLVVVVSAMGKTTNKLIEMSSEVAQKPLKREMDLLLSTGETVSASLMSMALEEIGVDSIALTGYQAGIKTNGRFGKAFINKIDTTNIKRYLGQKKVVVVTGFQGEDDNRNITTLGRGGSDTTAVALAAALGCSCEIYSDVESVCTIDPTMFPNAKKLHKITYDDMMEMSANGAKVLEMRCVELAQKYKTPLYIGKSLELDQNKGTRIMCEVAEFERMVIKNISIKSSMIVFNVVIKNEDNEMIEKVFDFLSDNSQILELISLSNIKVSKVLTFSIPSEKQFEVEEWLKALNCEYSFSEELSKIVLVGSGIASHPKLASQVFAELHKNVVQFENITTSETSISFTTKKEYEKKAIEVLAIKFDL